MCKVSFLAHSMVGWLGCDGIFSIKRINLVEDVYFGQVVEYAVLGY